MLCKLLYVTYTLINNTVVKPCSRKCIRLTSLKAEAGTGLWGPGRKPVGTGEQTGVAACGGQLGRGQPEGKEVERIGEDVCVEWGGQD